VLLRLQLLGLDICYLSLLLESFGLLCDPGSLPLELRLLPLDLVPPVADALVHLVELELVTHRSRVLRIDRVQNRLWILLSWAVWSLHLGRQLVRSHSVVEGVRAVEMSASCS